MQYLNMSFMFVTLSTTQNSMGSLNAAWLVRATPTNPASEKRPSMSVTSPTFQHFIGPYILSAVLLSSQNRATASRSVAFVKTGDVISRRHSSSIALCPFTTVSAAATSRSRIGARAPIISTTWGSHGRRLAGSPDAIEHLLGAASKLVCLTLLFSIRRDRPRPRVTPPRPRILSSSEVQALPSFGSFLAWPLARRPKATNRARLSRTTSIARARAQKTR